MDASMLFKIDDPLDLVPEAMPSGENQEGKTPSWNPNTKIFEFRHPKIAFGPCALDSTIGNVTLVTNTWVALIGAVPSDGIGMCHGMVGYLPKGRWGFDGYVAISTPSPNHNYYVRVQQGTTETNSAQPKIAVGSPVTVGESIQVSGGTSNNIFTIPILATDIQCALARDHACQVWIEVYAENTGSNPGVAMSASSVVNIATRGRFIRYDGEYGTS